MSRSRAGHGASIGVELGSPPVSGVFTDIPELRGDIPGFSGTRDESNNTPHNEDIDSWTTGPIIRNPLTFTINYDRDNATHVALRAAWLEEDPDNRMRGWRFRARGGSAGTDEVIQSGEITSWEDMSPEGAPPRQATITVRMSKQVIVDGVSYGNAL